MKNIFNFFLIMFTILIVSCKKELQINSELKGFVLVHNQHGQLQSNNEGVKVELEGTDLVTYTDKEGFFTFTDVKRGIYNVKISKDGYYSFIERNIQVIEGQPTYVSKMFMIEIPNYQITDVKIVNDFFKFKINKKETSIGKYIYTVAYFSNDSNVSYNNYLYKRLFKTNLDSLKIRLFFSNLSFVVFYKMPFSNAASITDSVIYYNYKYQLDEWFKPTNQFYIKTTNAIKLNWNKLN